MGSGDKQGNDNISKMITELMEQIKEEASENKKIFREVKDQLEELRKQMEEIKTEVGNVEIDQAGGINQFLKIKVFNGHVGESPMEHIHSLERYFHFNKISEEGKTTIACSHLQGASQTWWDSVYQRPETFEKYKQALVKGYWSEDLQETIRQQVEQEKWRPGEGFAPFVQRQTARLRSLVATSLSEHQIVRIVRHNLPQNIEQMLIGAGTKTVEQLMETVVAFDNSRSTQDYRDKGFRHQSREPAVNTIRYGQQSKARKESTRTKTNNKVGLEIVNLVYDGNDAEIEAIRQPYPKIKVLVEGIGAEALIDSGSQVSVISKELFARINCTDPGLKTLPLKNSYVTLANGKRAQLASKQVWVEIQIRQRRYQHVLLILENLIQEVILGSDFLHQTGCCINYKTKEVILGEDKIVFNPQDTDQAIATCCVKGVREEPEPVIKLDELQMLNRDQRRDIKSLIEEYKHVFSDIPGIIKGYEHRIRLMKDQPYQSRSYPIPHQYQAEVEKQLKQMMEWGVISKCSSPFNNPVVIVKKKDGAVRICLDARQLNKITIADNNAPPPMQELLVRFRNKNIFSTFDLTASYWQIKLHPADRKYTAFRYNGRQYQFNRMPFGLKNSGAGLIQCLDYILSDEIKKLITVYVDDIVLASENEGEHLKHMKILFDECSRKGVRINLKKSTLVAPAVTFLGHIISGEGIRPNPEKIQAIQGFPRPKNKKNIRAFLGMCNFYNRFYKNFMDDMEPLLQLLRKDAPWEWTDIHEGKFQRVKQLFLEKVLLSYPDFGRPFFVQTDSSEDGMGANLFQLNEHGQPGVLAFISRRLKGPERNYTVTEKEALAIVWAFQKFRQFLIGSEIIVITDHKSLQFLNQSYLSNSRLIRWSLFLQEFNYTVRYCKGSENIVADTLSRYPADEEKKYKSLENIYIATIETGVDQEVEGDLRRLRSRQREDPVCMSIINQLERKGTASHTHWKGEERGRYGITKGLLYYEKISENPGRSEQARIVIPEVMRGPLSRYGHRLYGHYGARKVEKLLSTWFYWPGMYAGLLQTIGKCEVCSRTKPVNKTCRGPLRPIVSQKPNSMVAIDYYGPLPSFKKMKYLVVVYDLFTKLVAAYPVTQANASQTIKVMEQYYFSTAGKPESIISDHGTPFVSRQWKQWINRQGMKHILTSIRNPQSNPCERVMRELGRLFRVYINENHRGWVNQVQQMTSFINWSVNETTGFEPIRLHYGKAVPYLFKTQLPIPTSRINREAEAEHARKNILRAGRLRERRQGRAGQELDIGDRVMVKVNPVSHPERHIYKKFQNIYEGPYTVTQKYDNNAYIIADHGVEKGTFNARALKRVNAQEDPVERRATEPPDKI